MFTPKVDRISYGGAMIGEEEKEAIMRVINDQGGRRWTIGPESEALEVELAQATGVRRAVLTNSGSSALLVAVASLHLPKGSKVIVPALNFPTAFNAIIQNGLIPYVVDVDPNTLLLDLSEVFKAVSDEYIEAVIAVNIASNPVDLQQLRRVVGSDVKIILDNCDGYGTTINGRYVETYADLACVSFHAAHIITMGEGGAVLTNDETLADRCKKIREWGRASGTDNLYDYPGLPSDYRERYVYEEIGYNMKPLELQCAMGRIQLKKINDFKKKRMENFDQLYEGVNKLSPTLKTVKWNPDAEVCWFSFPFLCEGVSRAWIMQKLEENNIECRTIFSGNILRHPAYKKVDFDCNYQNLDPGNFVHADHVMSHGVFISVHPSITKEMNNFILETLEEAIR